MNTPFVIGLAISAFGGVLYVPVDAGMWHRSVPVVQSNSGRPFDAAWYDSLLSNSSKGRGFAATGSVAPWGLANVGRPWARPGHGAPQSDHTIPTGGNADPSGTPSVDSPTNTPVFESDNQPSANVAGSGSTGAGDGDGGGDDSGTPSVSDYDGDGPDEGSIFDPTYVQVLTPIETDEPQTHPVPAPGALLLGALGLVGLIIKRREVP